MLRILAVFQSAHQVLLPSLALALLGCFPTKLPDSAPLSQKVFELAAANSRPLALSVTCPSEPYLLGYQFLFIVIPFGRVELPDPKSTLSRASYQFLARQGFKLLTSQPLGASHQGPGIHLKLDSFSVNVYDFIFVRRVSAEVAISAEFSDLRDSNRQTISGAGLSRTASARANISMWVKFGFHREISKALHQALEVALQET
ncbi:MAG: hypothetical protein DCC75_12275, partial [Proteobacteria bacterium]